MKFLFKMPFSLLRLLAVMYDLFGQKNRVVMHFLSCNFYSKFMKIMALIAGLCVLMCACSKGTDAPNISNIPVTHHKTEVDLNALNKKLEQQVQKQQQRKEQLTQQ